MAVKIRKVSMDGKKAVLVSFSTDSEKFDSAYERNKFFRNLWGWKQVVKKNSGRYSYRREGLMDNTPHIKVDKSVFIVALKHMKRMMRFFEDWSEKVSWKAFPIELEEDFMEGGKNVKAKKINIE